MEWRFELNLWTKTILTRGSNFSWIEQVGHRLDRERARQHWEGDFWNEDGNICVEDGRTCFCKPIKGWSKTSLIIYKNCIYLWKNVDWYWARNSIESRWASGKKTDYSSSTRKTTSRRRWGDWILEIKDYLRNYFENSQHWSDDVWKSKMAGGGSNKKRFHCCTDSSGQECDGCDIVQSDHAPEAGVAQGIFHGDLIRHQGGHQEEVEEELKEEVERLVRRDHSRH